MTASAAFKEKIYMVEEYLELEERSQEKHEYYNGKIIKIAGGLPVHNQIAMHIGAELRFALKKIKKKFLIYNSDTKIQIPDENLFVYPDAVVVCEKPILYKNTKDVIINPLLIVEVLSNSTEKYDRGTKFGYYQTLPSFQEYVLLSQTKPRASVYHRKGGNIWEIDNITEGVLNLESIGCQISLADIYEDIIFEVNDSE